MKRPRGGIPVRDIIELVRSDWRLRYRFAEQPSSIEHAGIKLELDDRWGTPAVRKSIYLGLYEMTELRILEATLRPDDRFLEVGAGIGFITACACRRLGDVNVTAYEANSELAAVATATLRRNGFVAEVVNAALGERDGQVDFYVHEDFWTSTLDPSRGGTPRRVPMRTLRGELERLRPTYLMVDIEGGEVDLLAQPLPPHVRAVCVETHPAVVGTAALSRMLGTMTSNGFQLDLTQSGCGVAYLDRDVQ
jgi:FkbM family methyltransferase